MKPLAVLLAVSCALLLGACGERGEEAAAPASGPAGVDREAQSALAEASTPEAVTPGTVMPEAVTPGAAAPASNGEVRETGKANGTTVPPAATAAPTRPESPAGSSAPAAASGGAAPSTPVAATAPAVRGTVLRAEKLHREPAAGSPVTGAVAKDASVEILARQSGWLRVKAGSQDGWIRLLSVRTGSGGSGGVGVGEVVGAAKTRSDPTRVVAVAGLRGLDSEDLKQAEFNGEELARMEAGSVSAAQAAGFASRSGLAAVRVPDLPKPQAR